MKKNSTMIRISDIWYYVQGNVRYFLVRKRLSKFIRRHVLEQVVMRELNADKECKAGGRCRICGCHTPALFYADKACDKPCYPAMMCKEEWERFKAEGGDEDWIYIVGTMKLVKVKEVI